MKTLRTLLPGQSGTKKLLNKYGEDLVCIRYRYDEVQNVKTKTVELIIEKAPWYKDSKRIPKIKL